MSIEQLINYTITHLYKQFFNDQLFNERMTRYDLEERTEKFARNVRIFINKVDKKFHNLEDLKQILRSSGSIGANYIVANEALSKKDFLYRIRICRKEIKETRYWSRLVPENVKGVEERRLELLNESNELLKIFSKIVNSTIHK